MRSSIYGISHHTLRHNVLYLNQAWNATRGMLKIIVTKDEGNIKLLLRRNSLSFFLKDA